jgi:hypothetical protein
MQMGGLMKTDEEADESWLQSRSSVLEASGTGPRPDPSWLIPIHISHG